jgi:hypothetical protein
MKLNNEREVDLQKNLQPLLIRAHVGQFTVSTSFFLAEK